MFFSDNNISQGSVATRLRCGEIFYDNIAGNVLLSLLVKEFENWPALAKLKAKIKWFHFFRTRCS